MWKKHLHPQISWDWVYHALYMGVTSFNPIYMGVRDEKQLTLLSTAG